jgi:hypothetical protein
MDTGLHRSTRNAKIQMPYMHDDGKDRCPPDLETKIEGCDRCGDDTGAED